MQANKQIIIIIIIVDLVASFYWLDKVYTFCEGSDPDLPLLKYTNGCVSHRVPAGTDSINVVPDSKNK